MLKKLVLAIMASVVAIVPATASTMQTIDISTGIDITAPGNPVLTVPGTADPFWRVIATPNNSNIGAAKIPDFAVSPYFAWQKIAGTNYIYTGLSLGGKYEYERCFCLADPKEAKLSVEVRADNQVQVFLNSYGNSIVNVTANDSFRGPNAGRGIATSGFFPGRNCVRVRVNNENLITGMDAKITVAGYGARDSADACCKEIKKPFGDKTQTGPLTVAQVVNGQIRDQIDPLKIRQAFNEAIGTEEAAVESEIVRDGSTWMLRIYSESLSGEKFRSAAVPLELNGASLILPSTAGWFGCQSPEKCIKQWCVSNSSGGCNCAVGAPGLCKRRVIDRMFPARFFEAVRNYALNVF